MSGDIQAASTKHLNVRHVACTVVAQNDARPGVGDQGRSHGRRIIQEIRRAGSCAADAAVSDNCASASAGSVEKIQYPGWSEIAGLAAIDGDDGVWRAGTVPERRLSTGLLVVSATV